MNDIVARKRRYPLAWDCGTPEILEQNYNGMADDLDYTWGEIERLNAECVRLSGCLYNSNGQVNRLLAAAEHAKQTISRYLSHQVSHQDSYVELRNARRALTEALTPDKQTTE